MRLSFGLVRSIWLTPTTGSKRILVVLWFLILLVVAVDFVGLNLQRIRGRPHHKLIGDFPRAKIRH